MHERFIRRYMLAPINETDEQTRQRLRAMFAEPHIESWAECRRCPIPVQYGRPVDGLGRPLSITASRRSLTGSKQ